MELQSQAGTVVQLAQQQLTAQHTHREVVEVLLEVLLA
jgi:hypothetical protein